MHRIDAWAFNGDTGACQPAYWWLAGNGSGCFVPDGPTAHVHAIGSAAGAFDARLAMDQALTHVLATTQYAARWQVAMDRARVESKLSDAQWWQTVGPRLSDMLGDKDLPVSSRVGQTVANAGDPSGFCTRAVESIIVDLERRIADHH